MYVWAKQLFHYQLTVCKKGEWFRNWKVGRNIILLNSQPLPSPRWHKSPLVGQVLIIYASRSHSDTSNLVGLLWTSDQPESETST